MIPLVISHAQPAFAKTVNKSSAATSGSDGSPQQTAGDATVFAALLTRLAPSSTDHLAGLSELEPAKSRMPRKNKDGAAGVALSVVAAPVAALEKTTPSAQPTRADATANGRRADGSPPLSLSADSMVEVMPPAEAPSPGVSARTPVAAHDASEGSGGPAVAGAALSSRQSDTPFANTATSTRPALAPSASEIDGSETAAANGPDADDARVLARTAGSDKVPFGSGEPPPARPVLTAHAGPIQSAPAPNLAEQIHGQISAYLDQVRQLGRVEVQLDLHPPELGRVQMHLAMNDGHMNVRMLVQDEAVKRLVELQLEPLRVRFAEMGVSVGQFDVRRDNSSPYSERPPRSEPSAQAIQTGRNGPGRMRKAYGQVANAQALVDVIA